jgi:hypothetical protein
VVLLAVVFGGAEPAAAQMTTDTTRGPERVSYAAVGSQYLSDIGDLNGALRASGFSTTHRTALSLGAGGYRPTASGLMFGLEAQGLIGFEDVGGRRDAPIGGFYGLGNLGYQLVSTSSVRVYPFAGLGLGASVVSFEANDDKPERDFQDVLDDPDRRSTLVQGAVLAQAGVGVEYRFSLDAGLGRWMDFSRGLLGLRVGYVVDPATTDWSLGQGEDLDGGPDAAPSGPYVRLVLGGL